MPQKATDTGVQRLVGLHVIGIAITNFFEGTFAPYYSKEYLSPDMRGISQECLANG